MQSRVDESIEVLARFKKGVLTPLFFKLKNRVYKIESVNLRYDLTEGNVKFLSYSVSSGPNTYKITLDTKTMDWKLGEVWSE